MSVIRVSALFIYPFKAGPAIAVDAWQATERGFLHDRRFVVTDPEGEFLTQRTHPALGRTRVALTDSGLRVSADSLGDAEVDRPTSGEVSRVRIWGDEVEAIACAPAASEWFSALLGEPAQLFYMPDDSFRPTDEHPDVPLSFADGYPYLIANTSSLDDLNARIPGSPLPMEAFRPNIVVEGAPAWAEDDWNEVRIGGATFAVVSDCERCSVTTLDPTNPDRPRADGEPLRTLAKFRRNDRGKVTFARNAIARDLQVVRVSDGVEPG